MKYDALDAEFLTSAFEWGGLHPLFVCHLDTKALRQQELVTDQEAENYCLYCLHHVFY